MSTDAPDSPTSPGLTPPGLTSLDPTSLDPTPVRARLRAALSSAMKRRDRQAASVLRATLGAIENAEAVEQPAEVANASLAIEAIAIGVGAAETERRELTEADVLAIVRAELAERESAAELYERAGRPEQAERPRAESAVLAEFA